MCRVKIKLLAGPCSLWRLRGEAIYLPFWFPEAAHIPWLLACSLFKASSSQRGISRCITRTLTLLFPSFTCKDPCDYTRPAWKFRVISHLKIIHFITSAQSLLLDKVTYSQVQGLGSFFEGRGVIQPTTAGQGSWGLCPMAPAGSPRKVSLPSPLGSGRPDTVQDHGGKGACPRGTWKRPLQ